MTQHVLLGDPAYFHIQVGGNPHTRDAWGRRKRVDLARAVAQWNGLKAVLENHGVQVHVVPPVRELPGLVFPANAGFRTGGRFYLSNLNPARSGEKGHYRRAVSELGLEVRDFPSPHLFEGEADFIPVGHPSGDAEKTVFLFTYGLIQRPRWVPRLGIPPYRRIYGFRSDRQVLPVLEEIVHPLEIIPLELTDEAHYHGDTVLYALGPHREYLLAYLNGLSSSSQNTLRRCFGNRLIPLLRPDGRNFAANSFQIETSYYGQTKFVLLMPDGLTDGLCQRVRSFGVLPCPVDVSEFLEKGGGAVKCMLLDLGQR